MEGQRGISLIELVVGVTVVGILAMVTVPVLVDFLESFWLAQNQSMSSQVARNIVSSVSKELREACSQPDSLKPFIYGGGSAIRFYRAGVPSDSIRYYFDGSTGHTMLFRSAGEQEGVPVPNYALDQVDFVIGGFSTDNGTYGFVSSGKVKLTLRIGKRLDFTEDTTSVEVSIYCRNFLD